MLKNLLPSWFGNLARNLTQGFSIPKIKIHKGTLISLFLLFWNSWDHRNQTKKSDQALEQSSPFSIISNTTWESNNNLSVSISLSESIIDSNYIKDLEIEYKNIRKEIKKFKSERVWLSDDELRLQSTIKSIKLYGDFWDKLKSSCVSTLTSKEYKKLPPEDRLKYEEIINNALIYYAYTLGKLWKINQTKWIESEYSTSSLLEETINLNFIEYMLPESKVLYFSNLWQGYSLVKDRELVIKYNDLSFNNFININEKNQTTNQRTRAVWIKLSGVNQLCFILDELLLNKWNQSEEFTKRLREYEMSINQLNDASKNWFQNMNIAENPEQIFNSFDSQYNHGTDESKTSRNYILISRLRQEFYKTQYKYFISIKNNDTQALHWLLNECSRIEEISIYFERQKIDMVDIFSFTNFLRAKIHYTLGNIQEWSKFMEESRKRTRSDKDLLFDLAEYDVVYNLTHNHPISNELDRLLPDLFMLKREQAFWQTKTSNALLRKTESQKQKEEIANIKLKESKELITIFAWIALLLAGLSWRIGRYRYKKLEDKAPSKEHFEKIYRRLILNNLALKTPILNNFYKKLEITLLNQISWSFDISWSSDMSSEDFYTWIKDEFIELLNKVWIYVLKLKEWDDFDFIYKSNFIKDYYIKKLINLDESEDKQYLENKIEEFMNSLFILLCVLIPQFNRNNIHSKNPIPWFNFKWDVSLWNIVFSYSHTSDYHNAQHIFVPASRWPKPKALARNGFVFRFKKTRDEFVMYQKFLEIIRSKYNNTEIHIWESRVYSNIVNSQETLMKAVPIYITPKLTKVQLNNDLRLKITWSNKWTWDSTWWRNYDDLGDFDEDRNMVNDWEVLSNIEWFNRKVKNIRKDKHWNCYYCELDNYEWINHEFPSQYIKVRRQINESGKKTRKESYMKWVTDKITRNWGDIHIIRFSFIKPELEMHIDNITK